METSGGIPARWLPPRRSIPSEFLPPWRTFFRLFCRRGGSRDDDCDGGNFFSVLSSGPFDLHESHAKTLRLPRRDEGQYLSRISHDHSFR